MGEIFARATGLEQQEIRDYLFALRMNKSAAPTGNLYTKFRNKYNKVWEEYLEWFLKSAGFISPYELIISIYQRFRVMSNFPGNQAFFIKFLDFVKSAEAECIALDDLLVYLAEAGEKREADVYVSAPRLNSIKVQTIHKSKGLEFPVVIIPFLEPDIKRTNPSISKTDQGIDLLYINHDLVLYSDKIKKIYYNDYLNNLIDELNGIYVALTRAKNELYVFIPGAQQKNEEYSNEAFYLIPKGKEDVIERGAPVTYEKQGKAERSEIKAVPLSDYQDWLKTLKEDSGDISLLRNRGKIMEGSVMHFLLAQIPNCLGADQPELIKNSVKDAKRAFPFVRDFTDYQGKLQQIINHPDFKQFFYTPASSVWCEKEFANQYGDSRRIDRLVVTDKEALIIDYKSSGELREEYQKQVKEYAGMVSAVYPQCKVKAYIVFLDTLKIEIVEID
jgi:ATP-dependent exoDNAse (exonuclease V) beta subunit